MNLIQIKGFTLLSVWPRFPGCTRELPKCPKMAVKETGHLYEYAYRCQNAPFEMGHFFFSFEMRHFDIGDKNVTENGAFWHLYIHLVTFWSPMPKYLISKGKLKWGILASVCIFMQVTYLCHSHFGAFWQPSCTRGSHFSAKNCEGDFFVHKLFV